MSWDIEYDEQLDDDIYDHWICQDCREDRHLDCDDPHCKCEAMEHLEEWPC